MSHERPPEPSAPAPRGNRRAEGPARGPSGRLAQVGAVLVGLLVVALVAGLSLTGSADPEPSATEPPVAAGTPTPSAEDPAAAAAAAAAEAERARAAEAAAKAARKAEKKAAKKAAKVAARKARVRKQRRLEARTEVWQHPEWAYEENKDNPLAGRLWGVYSGPQDQVSVAEARASAAERAALAKITRRPRTKWYGSFVPDGAIRSQVQQYIAASQNGNPNKLVQFAVFRMEPWEHEACGRRSSGGELASYRRWIDELAAGVGSTPTLVVMQPDGPFLFCAPDRAAKAAALSYATQKLSSLPRTSVYIDAGAADWCENDRGADPERCAQILKETGVRYARGFALDSTHYTGPVDNIRHGKEIVDILERDGYGTKRFIIDTAKSGEPTMWNDMRASRAGGLKDDAVVCASATESRCVTLGIPPTTRVAEKQYGFSGTDRKIARTYVDGFVWFGRPWLYKQADPFVMSRAVTMSRSTSWPLPD